MSSGGGYDFKASEEGKLNIIGIENSINSKVSLF